MQSNRACVNGKCHEAIISLLSISTGICGGTKSESYIFGISEIEGNKLTAGLSTVTFSQ